MVNLETLVDHLMACLSFDQVRSLLGNENISLLPQAMAELEKQANQLRLENPCRALHLSEILLWCSAFMPDDRQRANALRLKGNLLVHVGDYSESLRCYQEAQEIRTRHEEWLEIARLQVGQTAALKNLGRYEEALKVCYPASEMLERYEKWDWLANLELNVGSILRHLDRFEDALVVYERCSEHFSRAGSMVGLAQARVNAARVLGCLDRYEQARSLLQDARQVFVDQHAWLQTARTDLNLAILDFWSGKYQQAWERFEQARQQFKQLENDMEAAVVDLYSSQVYLALNLYPEALETSQRAEIVFLPRQMARHVALASLFKAQAQRGLGKITLALDLFEQAYRFFAEHDNPVWSALIDLERAVLLIETNRCDEALAVVTQAISVFKRYGLTIRLAQAKLIKARAYDGLDKMKEARRLYRSILNLSAGQVLPGLKFRANFGMGQIEERCGRRKSARRYYHEADAAIDEIHKDLHVDQFKAGFLDDKLNFYQYAVRLNLELGLFEEAFEYVEKAKSSTLLDLLARNLELRTKNGSQADHAAWEKLRTLKEKWNWYYSKLTQPVVEGKEDAPRTESGDDETWALLQQVEAQISAISQRLQANESTFLNNTILPKISALKEILEVNALLIEYYCIGDKIIAFLLSGDGLQVYQEFPASILEVKRSLNILDLALKDIGGLGCAYTEKVLKPLAQRQLHWLYSSLVAPLDSIINRYKKIIIAPHDILYRLPFHAYFDGKNYLLERFDVQYTLSASVLEMCQAVKLRRGEKNRNLPALILGYSNEGKIQFAIKEARAAASVLSNPVLLQEDEASLERLRQFSGHCRLVHLASHGIYRADNPLFSFIRLADQSLNAIDLYHLDLDASLVTLSACETGMVGGKENNLFGFIRGCLAAGVPTLIASLWKVDDASTALLMTSFYRHLEEGRTLAQALRQAQLEVRQVEENNNGETSHPFDHPYYWASFILVGADGEV